MKYISQILDQSVRQDQQSGMEAQEDSCKARGNRSGKLPEVVIIRKHRLVMGIKREFDLETRVTTNGNLIIPEMFHSCALNK